MPAVPADAIAAADDIVRAEDDSARLSQIWCRNVAKSLQFDTNASQCLRRRRRPVGLRAAAHMRIRGDPRNRQKPRVRSVAMPQTARTLPRPLPTASGA